MRVEQSLGAASLLLGLFYFLFPDLLLSRGVFIIGMILVTALVLLSRKFLDRAWQLTAPVQRVVILGTGQLALELAREINAPRRPRHETGGICRRRRSGGRKRDGVRIPGPGTHQRNGGHRQAAWHLQDHCRPGRPAWSVADQGVGDSAGPGCACGRRSHGPFGADGTHLTSRRESELVRLFRWIPPVQVDRPAEASRWIWRLALSALLSRCRS